MLIVLGKSMSFRQLFLPALILLLATSVEAKRAPTVTRHTSNEMKVICQPLRECNDLLVFHQTEDYYIDIGGTRFHGTRMRAGFRVEDVADVTEYVFVQFIRGGVFSTARRSDGSIERSFNFVKPHNSELTTFYFFPEWVVDSVDGDPTYWSTPGKSRTAAYLFSEKGDNPWAEGRPYGTGEVPVQELYVIDRPALAFRGRQSWINVALEFRTCLFQSKDVSETIPSDVASLLSRALYCFDWRSVHVWDHKEKRWRSDLPLEEIFPDAPGMRPEGIYAQLRP